MGSEDVLENSGIPGAGILASESTSKVRKRIWVTIILAGAFAFVIHLIILIMRLVSYPVIVDVAYRGHPFEFPDVTLCHNGPYSMLRSKHSDHLYTIDDSTGVQKTGQDIVQGIKNFWKALLPEYQNLSFNGFSRDDNKVARMSLYPYGNKLGLGHERQETIIGCDFKEDHCDFRNFTVMIMPKYVSCFTFSPLTDDQTFSTMPGEFEGLSLIIMDADRYKLMTEMETLDFIRGLKVFIHPKKSYPHKEVFEVAQVGKFTKIGLQLTENHRINTKASPCEEEPGVIALCPTQDKDDCRSYDYTQELCSKLAAQDEIFNHCHCLSEEFPVSRKHLKRPFCHAVEPNYISPNYEKHASNSSVTIVDDTVHLSAVPKLLQRSYERYLCHKKVTRKLRSSIRRMQKGCETPCVTKTFSTFTSIFDWPTHFKYAQIPLTTYGQETYNLAKQMYLDTILLKNKVIDPPLNDTEWLRERFIRLLIYPKTGYAVKMEETLAYPWSAFLSDIGGILGLWVGFSVITIVEVIEWLILKFKECGEKRDKKARKAERGKRRHLDTDDIADGQLTSSAESKLYSQS